ncbi:FecR domain-containing protein [uncultured Draconibacterium sp.]|uniref:FecR family protein n=1 Tax=uncultured Draconibacterium sp. TaxID=1573823 RepID=UPI002AA89A35|nr:FecR domain-containing protein [uncultured Draconibacterium sp.]
MNKIYQIMEVASLIAKKLSNQLDSEESKSLSSWKKESTKNEELFNKITDWDNYQERNKAYNIFNSEKAWKHFSKNIEKSKKRIGLTSLLKYAAAITVPLILGGLIFFHLSNTNEQLPQKVTSIMPGTQNAIVILDDGEEISLEDENLDQLVEKDGSVIRNINGELSYSEVESKRKKRLQNTLVVPRGGEYNLILSDGSKVFLNSMSQLSYPVNFEVDKREVTLEGEAYFEIERDENRPFLVNINGLKIEVLGTSFNVKGYNDEDEIYTTLVEGKVKLNTSATDDDLILIPDQQAILEKKTDNIIIHDVDASQFIGWKNGIYSFSDQSIEEIMKTLSRWYDFEYEFKDDSLKDLKFEGGLNKYDDIDPILDIIESTGKLKIEINGNKITFM